jgi:hypothetical protein
VTIIEFLNVSELQTRQTDIRAQIAKCEERLRTMPTPSPGYCRRNDLSLAAELHKYLGEVTAELYKRHTGDVKP